MEVDAVVAPVNEEAASKGDEMDMDEVEDNGDDEHLRETKWIWMSCGEAWQSPRRYGSTEAGQVITEKPKPVSETYRHNISSVVAKHGNHPEDMDQPKQGSDSMEVDAVVAPVNEEAAPKGDEMDMDEVEDNGDDEHLRETKWIWMRWKTMAKMNV
ncbi:hypothetical protein Q3G72_015600 [Acer saccharum]|nr:hypothetical protein Q3G72_015600 [Acer saccharum]